MQNSVLETNVSQVSRHRVVYAHTILMLNEHNWNRTHTSKALGISLRTLQRNMQAWGIDQIFSTEAYMETAAP